MSTIDSGIVDFGLVIRPDHYFREKYDKRDSLCKIKDFLISLFLEIGYQFKTIILRRYLPDSLYHDPNKKITWKQNSEGLVVLLHGANGHPHIWDTHQKELDKHQNLDRYIPLIPEAGTIEIDRCAPALLNNILDYHEEHPENPVALLGTSNGSRLATWLEAELRKRCAKTAVKVATIGGVHFGTPIIQGLNKWNLTKWLVSPAIAVELAYGSERSKEILSRVLEPLAPECGKRDYEFWASLDDLAVRDLGSSLPVLNRGERHYIISGSGHNVMVDRVAKTMIENVVKWTNEINISQKEEKSRPKFTPQPPPERSMLLNIFDYLSEVGEILSSIAA